jgi:hypothetical protein
MGRSEQVVTILLADEPENMRREPFPGRSLFIYNDLQKIS